MKKPILRTAAVLLAITSAAIADPTPAGPYEIKFDRPQKAGQVFDVRQSVEITQSLLASVNDKEVQKQNVNAKYAMEGTMQVLEVDDKGRCSKFHLTITKLQATESDAPLADTIKGELQIDATFGDNKIDCKIVKTEDKIGELASHALGAMPIFVPRAATPKFTSDDLYGATDKKKVGDQWNMDIKNKGEALGLNPDKTTGTVKLEGVKNANGIAWLEIIETLDAGEISDPKLGKAKDAKLAVKVVDSLPVDVANPSEKSQSNRVMHGIFSVPQKDGTTANVTLDRTEKRESSSILTATLATQPATQPK